VSADGRITKNVKDHSENMRTMESISNRFSHDRLLSFKKQRIQLQHMLGREECYTHSDLFALRTLHNKTVRKRDEDNPVLHPLYKELASLELEKQRNLEAHHGEHGFVHVKLTDLPPRSRRPYEDRYTHRLIVSPQAKEVIKFVGSQPHLRKIMKEQKPPLNEHPSEPAQRHTAFSGMDAAGSMPPKPQIVRDKTKERQATVVDDEVDPESLDSPGASLLEQRNLWPERRPLVSAESRYRNVDYNSYRLQDARAVNKLLNRAKKEFLELDTVQPRAQSAPGRARHG
jgi:hypothetical protein